MLCLSRQTTKEGPQLEFNVWIESDGLACDSRPRAWARDAVVSRACYSAGRGGSRVVGEEAAGQKETLPGTAATVLRREGE